MLSDVADDDSRRSPKVYHSVATINAAEILDELFADISVSERQHDGDGANTHPFMEVDKRGEHTKGQTPGLVLVRRFEQIGHIRRCEGCCNGRGQATDPSLTTWCRSQAASRALRGGSSFPRSRNSPEPETKRKPTRKPTRKQQYPCLDELKIQANLYTSSSPCRTRVQSLDRSQRRPQL